MEYFYYSSEDLWIWIISVKMKVTVCTMKFISAYPYFLQFYLFYFLLLRIECYRFHNFVFSQKLPKDLLVSERHFSLKQSKSKWRLHTTSSDLSVYTLKLDSNSNYNNLKFMIFHSLNSSSQVPTPFISVTTANLPSPVLTEPIAILDSQPSTLPLSFDINISDDIQYRNDLIDIIGSDEYTSMIKQWSLTSLSELCEAKTCIDKIAITTIPFILTPGTYRQYAYTH